MASSELSPPAQPAFILRGHPAQIHALHFTEGNARLLSADADGWVISWNLSYKRPVAVWKAHSHAVLAINSWGSERIITHGRDNKVLVWQLKPDEEPNMDRTLPVDGESTSSHRLPWLLYTMPVNALNFCSFAMCLDGMAPIQLPLNTIKDSNTIKPLLLAVPNAIDSGGIDVFQLPSRRRAATINSDRVITTGMVMALGISADSVRIRVAAGYESGHTMVFIQADPSASFERIYSSQPHSQPVLSLALSPDKDHFLTSSADAKLVMNPFPASNSVFKTPFKPLKISATKHSGQQGLSYRSDGKLFATAGWDAAARVYSGKTLKEVAVLRWHREGCYATAFGSVGAQHEKMVAVTSPLVDEQSTSLEVSPVSTSAPVSKLRDEKARSTHWLVLGSKDGKISLWNIF